MSDWIVAYLTVTVITGIFAAMPVFLPSTKDEERSAARVLLTCWAWPVWLSLAATAVLKHIWRAADL